ncbi:MAG: tetraacyldisaccharide 4'-kinase, partial [Rhodobacterales bacterium]|nr:tetraacyldisaccharide 4'-kinase [Rhodobacterales bacterium]
VLVLDDGHQNPALVKDLSLVVVDGSVGFGNGRVIPAGPLREPVAEGLARADALVILGDDARHVASQAGNRPVLRARVVADGADLAGRDVLAFAGIGRPGKLFDTLRGLGARVVAERSFADHHPYTAAEIAALKARAAGMGALLVTTEKDAARLLADQVAGIHVLTITLQWADEGTLDALLDRLDP